MSDKYKLIKLQEKSFKEWYNNTNKDTTCFEFVTDCLLANGVILPPCKIDDPVYFVGKYTGQITNAYVTGIQKTEHDMFLFTDAGCFVSVNQQLGKTVFLTKEEAEQALKERDG